MPRVKITEEILNKIIKEYQDNKESTVVTLADKFGYNKSYLYKQFKIKNVKLFKSGWNNLWRGEKPLRKGRQDYKKRTAIRKKILLSKLEKQEYSCTICGTSIDEKTAHLDHCHKNGRIRDFLCRSCNHGLGSFKDSISSLKSAILYLEKHKAKTLVRVKR